MRNYEMMVILDPALSDEERDTLIGKLRGIIEKNGKMDSVEVWGKRPLAYEIKHRKEGYYVIFYFESDPTTIDQLKREIRMNNAYLRELIIKK